MRYLPALPLLLVVAASACGGSKPSTASTTTPATAGSAATRAHAVKPKLRVVVTAENHRPRLGHTWTYRVRVTAPGGKPVACRIHVQFFFNGMPVGEVGVHHIADGLWKETIPAAGKDAFPRAALGEPLVLHATATASRYRTGTGGWKIVVVE